MLENIALIYLLVRLQAPAWCYWLVGIAMTIRFIRFLCEIYKIGKESK